MLITHRARNHTYDSQRRQPVLLIDVWEHAYAYDRWNDRQSYVDELVPLIDWSEVERRLGVM